MATASERSRDATNRLLEAESTVLQALAAARATISALERENDELRREVANKQVEIFTEREFAARLKVSTKTLANLRKAGRLMPLMVGESIRYSATDHLEKVGEIFAAKSSGARALGQLHGLPRQRRTG